MGDALREHISRNNGPVTLYVVVGRGGPNLVRGMGIWPTRSTASACPTGSSLDQRDFRGSHPCAGGWTMDARWRRAEIARAMNING